MRIIKTLRYLFEIVTDFFGYSNRSQKVKKPLTVANLVDVMSNQEKKELYWLLLLFGINVLFFLKWLFNITQFVDLLTSLFTFWLGIWALLYTCVFIFFVSRMKITNPDIPLRKDKRVAMLVTKTPSEPFWLVKETLMAMLSQNYPHDNWLADEDPTIETVTWCKKHNVFISTRKNVPKYHRSTWPRKTKSKEGNLAYFYDTYGYERYDIVVQLDADHKPHKGYLEEMVRPFADPSIGYVSAPSMCDRNANQSWIAKGRLYTDATYHGILQTGHNGGWAPSCIGSSYAIRTKALKEIGGIGPELVEDHTTTLAMNAYGWNGIHALNAQIHGYGPFNLTDCITQEFQWARSMIIVLLNYTPKYLKTLPLKLKFWFVAAQLWYFLYGLSMFIHYIYPLAIIIFLKIPFSNLYYISLLSYLWFVPISTIYAIWIKKRCWLRPQNSKIFAWETFLYNFFRWPWILYGSISAIIGIILKKQFIYRVTPKENNSMDKIPIKIFLPHIIIAISSVIALVICPTVRITKGIFYHLIINSVGYSILILVITLRHVYENHKI